MKTLSILVPVYNTEKYIKRCMDSILLKEILDDIEVILVNDESKDNSLKIIKQYEKKYPQSVIIIDKKNGGHGSTINEGLKIATGKYFRVIDSDDWVNSIDFIKLVKKIKNEDVDLIVTNYTKEIISSGISEKIVWNNLKDNKTYNFDNFDLSILNQNYFVMANSMYKTKVLKDSKLKLMEKTFYVDMQYNVVPILYIKDFKFLDLDIYRYFIGRADQSMNLQNFVKNRSNHEIVMKYLIEYFTKNSNKFSKNKKEYIRQIIFYMLITHYYIYCVYSKKDKKQIYKEIKSFDNYLKEINIELYKLMNNIPQIKYNRMTKFVFVRTNTQIFNKFISLCIRILRK